MSQLMINNLLVFLEGVHSDKKASCDLVIKIDVSSTWCQYTPCRECPFVPSNTKLVKIIQSSN